MPTRFIAPVRRVGWAAAVAAVVGVAAMTGGHARLAAVVHASNADTKVAQARGPVRLQKEPVWVELVDAERSRPLTRDILSGRITQPRVSLVLYDISAEAPPTTAFAVYLGLPPGAAPAKEDPHYVGRFGLYGEINRGPLQAAPSSRSYDITGVLQRLLGSKAMADPIGVTIVPERALSPASRPTIGNIAIVVVP
jgi:hypothetical protein